MNFALLFLASAIIIGIIAKKLGLESYGPIVVIRAKNPPRLPPVKYAEKLGELGVSFGFGLLGWLKKRTKLGLLYFLFLPVFRPLSEILSYFFLGFFGQIFVYLLFHGIEILTKLGAPEKPVPGVAPLIPGLKVGPISIPLVEGWLGIFLGILIHEGAHALVAARRKIPIKSWGLILFGFVPIGAFVEPEEEILEKDKKKHLIYGAGPAANLLLAFLLLSLASLAMQYMSWEIKVHGKGLKIEKVLEYIDVNGKKLETFGKEFLKPGDIIVSVSGKPTGNLEALRDVLRKNAGKSIDVVVIREGKKVSGKVRVNEAGYLGIEIGEVVGDFSPLYYAIKALFPFLYWIGLINLLIGSINFLPLPVFDGYAILLYLWPPAKRLRFLIWGILIGVLAINALPWFI